MAPATGGDPVIRAWMVIAPLTLAALAAFAAVVMRWQDRRFAADLAGRDGR